MNQQFEKYEVHVVTQHAQDDTIIKTETLHCI